MASNLGELRTLVRSYANRNDLSDTLLDAFINQALNRAIRSLRIPVMESLVTIDITNDNEVDIPADYLEAIEMYYNYAGRRYTLERRDIQFVEEHSTDTGEAKYFARKGPYFMLAPKPSITSVKLYYFGTFPELVETGDTNWFVAYAQDILLYGALVELALYIKDVQRATQWEAKFQNSLVEIQNQEDTAKWSGSTLRVRG